MAFTGKTDSNVKVPGGQQDYIQRGQFQFDGTALSVELPVKLSKIRPGAQLNPMPGTHTVSNLEFIYIEETPNADGEIDVDDDGEITITRKAEGGGSNLADLRVWYEIRGASKDY